MDNTDEALQLLTLMSDSSKFKEKLDEFSKRKAAAEEAEAKLREAQEHFEPAKNEIDSYIARRKGELNEAQIKHDIASTEAAQRIELANGQAQHLGEWEHKLSARETEMVQREQDVSRREKELATFAAHLTDMQAELTHRGADLESKHERLRAAMG